MVNSHLPFIVYANSSEKNFTNEYLKLVSNSNDNFYVNFQFPLLTTQLKIQASTEQVRKLIFNSIKIS